MTGQRLAVRNLVLGRGRAMLAIMLIGASLCVLDIFAGHMAGARAAVEYQAVIGKGLGHLSIIPASGDGYAPHVFDAGQTARLRRILQAHQGVALATPEPSATTQGSAVERLVVYLHDPATMARRREELTSAVRHAGIGARVLTWEEQSSAWLEQRGASELAFDSVAGMVFATIAATIAATLSMNGLERRRETATLRALGMRSSSVFLMVVAEGLWMTGIGAALSLVASGSISWMVNRIGLEAVAPGGPPVLLELDVERMVMAIVAVLAVSLLASLVPAFKAARAPVAPALSA
jgi:ABC-type lipoprotein release transport system permease subunit